MNSQILADTINSLELGFPQVAGNLAMFPLCRGEVGSFEYLMLDEALEGGLAEITEVSEQGSVPELQFLNKADRPTLLLDGDELVGAKQNRVLNLTILVAAKTSTKIPVSCVERGRWSYRSRQFGASGRMLHARARREKAAAVSASLHERKVACSDQGALWGEISRKASVMDVHSETEAMADIYAARDASLNEIRSGLQAVPGQVGAVFAINGHIAGIEYFDAPATCQRQLARLIDSYAMDAIEVPAGEAVRPDPAAIKRLLQSLVQAKVTSYKAIGIGDDLRIDGRELHGAALVAEDRVVHLSAHTMVA